MPSLSTQPQRASTSNATSPARPPPTLPNELLILAESQWLFTESELLLTPSILAGLSPQKERESRGKGVNFILQAGIMLKLPQITLATASVFLHRFFMRHSMVDDKRDPERPKPAMHYYSVAATALFLATKVEENCRKMKELVVACVRVAQKNPGKVVDEQDKEYWRWRDTILQLEDLLLESLCFDLTLESPYKTLLKLLVYFGEGNNKRLRNAAWAFVNDSCLTMLCLLFSSRTIAASALYAAARHCDVRFADDVDGRPWWEVVGVELKNVRKACNYMAGFYENTPLRSGEGSNYEKTPEDGDELFAKTREVRSGSGSELGMGVAGGIGERRSSTGSNESKASEGSKKRERDEGGEDVPWGGEGKEEREGKRRKIGENGTETNGVKETNGVGGEKHTNGTAAHEASGLVSPKLDDASEEGEVEP